ncbi:hypothetical protein [Mangrovibacterium lignilyticum]|uniref:hypothetical protein n=1 Tax=Mangrovibacterium lignilyticum TaxID=2668052 RepID=UPI0013D4523D|nr:hypothetical protein [Mangrovibacterium lignilyticum]
MTLQEASDFFERLKTETSTKSEIKIYDRFLYLLSALKSRAFPKEETQSLETELDRLQLASNPDNRKKYFKRALAKFERQLNDRFSLITKGYYTNLGTGLGLTFGVLLGVVVLSGFERSLGISLGLVIGMLIGLVIGRSMDSKATNEGRVL